MQFISGETALRQRRMTVRKPWGGTRERAGWFSGGEYFCLDFVEKKADLVIDSSFFIICPPQVGTVFTEARLRVFWRETFDVIALRKGEDIVGERVLVSMRLPKEAAPFAGPCYTK